MKPKTVLINPPWPTDKIYGKNLAKASGYMLPYGILSIASYCESRGYPVDLIDASAHNMEDEDVLNAIRTEKYDVVGLSCWTPSALKVYDFARQIKAIDPNILVVSGGAHPTILQGEFLDEAPHIDAAIMGEGEFTFCELLEAIDKKQDWQGVAGLIFRKEGKVTYSPPRPTIPDLNELPLPAYDKVDMSRYISGVTHTKYYPTYSTIFTRGCPFQCTFCGHKIISPKVRYKSPEKVVEEFLVFKEQYGGVGLTIQDSTLTIDKKWLMAVCDELIDKKVNMIWNCNARADVVNEDLLVKMRQAGCWKLAFGIESGNEVTLKKMKKGVKFSLEKVQESIALAKHLGFRIQTSFIVGFPWEDMDMVNKTIKFAHSLKSDWTMIYPLTPYPGTEIWPQANEAGGWQKDPFTWADLSIGANIDHPIYVAPQLDKDVLLATIKRGYRGHYMQPAVIWRHLQSIKTGADMKNLYRGFRAWWGIVHSPKVAMANLANPTSAIR